jgi:hypothetical protein
MAAAKKKPALHEVPAPAGYETAAQVLHRRTVEVREELEPIFGADGFNAKSWEIDALVIAVARGSAIGKDLVLREMALQSMYSEMELEADFHNKDTDPQKQAAEKDDDDAIF